MRKGVLLSILLSLASACSNDEVADIDEPLALYFQNELDAALPLFEQAALDHPGDADAYTWLGEVYRRVGRNGLATQSAELALVRSPCHSFAHTLLADTKRPGLYDGRSDKDMTWTHLNRAVECDPDDGNAWMSIWNESVLRNKPEMMDQAIRRMRESGYLTDAVLAYARWTLRRLPEHSVLITNGDLDTMPMLAVQVTEQYRTDVIVVERGLLGTAQYLRLLRDHYGVTLPVEEEGLDVLPQITNVGATIYSISDRIFGGWLFQRTEGTFDRPIAIAATVSDDFYTEFEDQLQFTGPFRLWYPTPVSESPAIVELEANLDGVQVENFAGPWASDSDRSPIHRLYTKNIASNITDTALALAEGFIGEGRFEDALGTLVWAEDFEQATVLGPARTERIEELRTQAREATEQ